MSSITEISGTNTRRIGVVLRRREGLTPVSHPALSFSWHLRLGFYREIGAARMGEYAKFFYGSYLMYHFESQLERVENRIPPVLFKKLQASQRALHRLFLHQEMDARILGRIEEKLEAQVRLEKQILDSDAALLVNKT